MITYDKDSDVLYITLEDAEAIAEEMDDGVFVRYKDNNCGYPDIVGITIMDFKKRYMIEEFIDFINKNLSDERITERV